MTKALQKDLESSVRWSVRGESLRQKTKTEGWNGECKRVEKKADCLL